jgi:hypothetical protein
MAQGVEGKRLRPWADLGQKAHAAGALGGCGGPHGCGLRGLCGWLLGWAAQLLRGREGGAPADFPQMGRKKTRARKDGRV